MANMEEADLLKERLQAITDKRRLQEDIAKKRRQIEEEKLKLQYIKKKALREQWLMDGLSQQSEEEQEAMRVQVQEEQLQSDELQSNILRMEKEIEDLETQELNVSANEEAVLKRLKEVERTTEDIIKEINADLQPDGTHHVPSALPDIPSLIPPAPIKCPPVRVPGSIETKKATFAMEISVEHDKKTGKSQVVSTATITPETLEEKAMKVFDDGRKSVYTLQPDVHNEAVGEMTLTEVEELLRQAAETKVSTEVQYHPPVYSVPYSGTRPSTPRTPAKTLRRSPTPTQGTSSSRNGAQILKEENLPSQDMEEQKPRNQTPCLVHQDSTSRVQRSGEEAQLPCFQHRCSQLHCGAEAPQGLTNSKTDVSRGNAAALVSIKVVSEGMPAAQQPVYRAADGPSPSLASQKSEVDPDVFTDRSSDLNRHSPFCSDDIPSVNLVNTLLQSESITMIFMGYENAADEEDEDIRAELVIISNSEDDDDDDEYLENESNREEYLSYHPEGYKSKVFQPKRGLAEVRRY